MRHPPPVHHHQFIRSQRHRQFVQHADHGAALRDQFACRLHPVRLMRRIEVGQRLVHQQQLGLDRQRARQQHALAFAARQLPQRTVAPVPGLGAAQCAFDGIAIGFAGCREPALVRQPPQHGDVVDHQVVGTALARAALAQPGQAPRAHAGRHGSLRLAEEPHLAAMCEQAGQRFQQRRLAGPVRSDDAGPAAGRERQVDAVQHLDRPERGAEAVRFERGGWRAAHRPPPFAPRRCISHSR
ncbi:hypothetical protein D3C87_946430 [compost metagenome]